ncbi:MAG: tRNA uridine(34) 5-carboxymethylaminomethyl modification radical SAM/GNAT enzyme Elp3 [Methanobrevibacter sp.]|uniref:tRNA uridine(34) 5-carboxymethylaminomethyl modification radical SAM/GNAT enzyme Elp3 n=2 Tax=Methanobrevibacter TaxID=2172 RepID=UPI0025D97EFA|nr:tRNA uridine(34) 5-carboxymethylaminomethyl modification radical SAM/GNAT enzyme Elp3 [Methanobrevibacter sp.]MBQ2613015.1 tRNA uridine(34) 5-carboxymethylaminomethyl modification radical SAM/GNAT enzyme Elp3 [Methanobrevibacter sp.]MEE0024501.1 tRNA uridine(34) 5-carboxymethylaminomethyl modification radical SAM/GNAT enzyme Elp3 [Methanobrevibacter sp.]
MKNACRIIINDIIEGKISTRRDLEVKKRQLCRDLKLSRFMSNADILEYATDEEKELVSDTLKKKPTRTKSGVAIVAVMCHPHKCPHGRCLYCPESDIAPPSYTGEEPAALRGRMFEYHPYVQCFNRLVQLKKIGHPIDKVELIIMGGTFPSRDLCYQEWFVSQCLKAMTDFGLILENNAEFEINKSLIRDFEKDVVKTYPPNDYVLIEDIQLVNENSKVRCVGMTFETRPDYCKKDHINRMLNFGVTRVELGVQTLSDELYTKVKRGHTIADVIESNQLLRDSAIKVAMHMMPGLFVSQKEDLKMFKQLFSDENFKPDMLKIYPCLVTKGSELYDMWQEGTYSPYTDEEAVDLIFEIKKILPKWVRTMRIQRDIPSTLIEAGVQKSNLGELVYNKLDEQNINCQCIRCREIGHKKTNENYTLDDFKLFSESYTACGGEETFISIEDKNEESIAGFLRFRLPSENIFRPEITEKTALIRELHVYGNMIQIGNKNPSIGQHTGFGERLLKEAENLAINNNKDEIAIISGIGSRNYYRKFGYERKGPYMAKKLI